LANGSIQQGQNGRETAQRDRKELGGFGANKGGSYGARLQLSQRLSSSSQRLGRGGYTSRQYADSAVQHFMQGGGRLIGADDDQRQAHMMAILWTVLTAASTRAEEPGRIADYIDGTDFVVDFHDLDEANGKFSMDLEANGTLH
jgi:hypothetical protein